MILFKKLCEECKNIKTVKRFERTKEFFEILQEIKRLQADGIYEYVGGNAPEDTIKYWPQDGVWYRVKCKYCGAIFTLWYDTLREKGYFKKGK